MLALIVVLAPDSTTVSHDNVKHVVDFKASMMHTAEVHFPG